MKTNCDIMHWKNWLPLKIRRRFVSFVWWENLAVVGTLSCTLSMYADHAGAAAICRFGPPALNFMEWHPFVEPPQYVFAGQWSPWQDAGDDISVSFTKVIKDALNPQEYLWTWRFRNDGSSAVSVLQFNYTDKDGNHSDRSPSPLKPGEILGGWSAYTASSSPTLRIDQVTRQ
jgi:hypothetical protein